MPKQKLSAKDVQAAEERTEAAQLRGIARQLGRCLSLTIVAALAGGNVEDEAIAAMDRSWERLADLVVQFAEGDDDAQGL